MTSASYNSTNTKDIYHKLEDICPGRYTEKNTEMIVRLGNVKQDKQIILSWNDLEESF